MDESYISRQRAQTFAFNCPRVLRREAMPGVFEMAEGERCVWLEPVWDVLLSDLENFGPVAFISQNGGAMLGATLPGLDFLSVPQSGEFIEQHTGMVIDSTRLGSVLAVEDTKCGASLFSLQFFDRAGRGEFKILLTTEADLEFFLQFTHHYALGAVPFAASLPAAGATLCEGALVLARAEDVRAIWPHLRHELSGRWLAGRPGVSRLDALALLGQAVARELPFDALIRVLLAARRGGWALTFALFRGDARQEAALIPRWMESCAGALHIFDDGAEAHFFPEQGGALWLVRWPREWVLEWFDPAGERLLTVRGPRGCAWESLIEALA